MKITRFYSNFNASGCKILWLLLCSWKKMELKIIFSKVSQLFMTWTLKCNPCLMQLFFLSWEVLSLTLQTHYEVCESICIPQSFTIYHSVDSGDSPLYKIHTQVTKPSEIKRFGPLKTEKLSWMGMNQQWTGLHPCCCDFLALGFTQGRCVSLKHSVSHQIFAA